MPREDLLCRMESGGLHKFRVVEHNNDSAPHSDPFQRAFDEVGVVANPTNSVIPTLCAPMMRSTCSTVIPGRILLHDFEVILATGRTNHKPIATTSTARK